MKRFLQSFALLLVALMVPTAASAADVQAADGVYQDGSTQCITSSVTANSELGDVNNDGNVNIADATDLIDYLLDGDESQINLINADTDLNGSIGIADVTEIIDYLFNGHWSWEETQPATETFTVNGVTFTMIAVEGGTFTMGGTAEQGSDVDPREMPAHQVTLSSYCIGQTEVTQALWQAVMGSNPSYFNDYDFGTNLQRPVEQVSWDDCQTFITQLNQLTGRTFRLPTEAEWEFAARGGNLSQGYKYAGSNTIDDVAWYWDNIPSQETQTVATKASNELGLYDMCGNVWEWCQDFYGYYSSEPQTNPVGPSVDQGRVCRGGGWGGDAWSCRVSCRNNFRSSFSNESSGLRLAL